MKKLVLLLAILMAITLSACEEEPPFEVDCDLYPTHEDCETEPVTCDEGYILEGEDCVLEETPPTCADNYILENGTCVFDDSELGDYLDIYYLNDFHGALTPSSDELGIAYIANLVKTRKEQSPDNVLFLAGGDMLQGSALSNYYEGLSTITLLNASLLDAFTIGNHEFDWGIETVLQYADGVGTNGEADFPFLGANIFAKETDELLDGVEPYTIIEKGDHKIGIIGTMGYGLEYSIAQSKIDDYYFSDPVAVVATYAEQLRTEENVDIVIVMAHDTGDINDGVAALTGDQKVDAIFNGHSHRNYATTVNGIPVMQSGSSGEYVGHLRLFIDTDGTITFEADNLGKYGDVLLVESDPDVQAILDQYLDETDAFFNTPIITSLDDYSSSELSQWLVHLIRVSMDVDIAFHNYGGTRTDVDDQEVISLGTLYAIWPFDNVIKTVELDGAIIQNLLFQSMAYDTDIEQFEAGTLYTVATNDYVFDKTDNPFLDGTNPTNTGVVLRDLVEVELTAQADAFDGFLVTNPIQTVPDVPSTTNIIYKEDEFVLFFIYVKPLPELSYLLFE